ncbi:MAG: hypothetical protein NVSMB34_11820 [Variovorax sp.]
MQMVSEPRGQHDSQWAAVVSNPAKIGCTPQTLLSWVRQYEPAMTISGRSKMACCANPAYPLRKATKQRKSIDRP